MNEQEFMALADAELARIEAALDAASARGGIEFDFEIKPGGVIEIELDDGSKVIVNRHGAAREIWLAARSGGYHFRYQARPDNAVTGHWVSSRDGEELTAALARVLAEQAGGPVELHWPH